MGGAKGAAAGLAAALPTAYVLNHRWPAFRGLTLPLKAFFVTMITVSSGVIAADKAGIAFEVSLFWSDDEMLLLSDRADVFFQSPTLLQRSSYTDTGAQLSRRNMTREEAQWAALSPTDKALTWTKENKFSVVAGS